MVYDPFKHYFKFLSNLKIYTCLILSRKLSKLMLTLKYIDYIFIRQKILVFKIKNIKLAVLWT